MIFSNQPKGNYMKCPLCKIEMSQRSFKNIEFDVCPKCKGIWFDKNELGKAKDAADKDLNWMDFEIWKHKDKFKISPRKLVCPKCKQVLVTINYGNTNIKIDYCPACAGTWLDKGEFKKIIKALNDELLSKPFSGYIKASIREAEEIFTGDESFLSEWKDFVTVLHLMETRFFVEHPWLQNEMTAIQKSMPR
jgi:Zn-finger nucleic acid-binding protein